MPEVLTLTKSISFEGRSIQETNRIPYKRRDTKFITLPAGLNGTITSKAGGTVTVPGHTFIANDEICIYNPATRDFFYATVSSVAGDVLTVAKWTTGVNYPEYDPADAEAIVTRVGLANALPADATSVIVGGVTSPSAFGTDFSLENYNAFLIASAQPALVEVLHSGSLDNFAVGLPDSEGMLLTTNPKINGTLASGTAGTDNPQQNIFDDGTGTDAAYLTDLLIYNCSTSLNKVELHLFTNIIE